MVMTYREMLAHAEQQLCENGIENAAFDCRELLAKAVDKSVSQLSVYMGEKAEDPVNAEFSALLERRIKGEPLQYILGEWEFYGLTFKVGEGVLIPRQDTETLVELVINKHKNSDSLTLVDLCSGSGCIPVALEKYLSCESIYAVEKSEKAMKYLDENIRLNASKVKSLQGDILDTSVIEMLPEADIITCNPPYLTSRDMNELQKEVTFEPEEALFGGDDGLDFYRAVTRLWKDKLKQGGMLIYEIGMGQEHEVMQIMIQHGFENVRCKPDACGIMRCVMGTKK